MMPTSATQNAVSAARLWRFARLRPLPLPFCRLPMENLRPRVMHPL